MKRKNKIISVLALFFVTAMLASCSGPKDTNPPIPEPEVEKEVSSIEVIQRPYQNIFMAGEAIDLSGLKVQVNYVDGTHCVVGHASLSYAGDNLTSGTTQIALSYAGVSTTLTGINVSNPIKTYLEGEANYAYWSKPNNHDSSNQFVISQEAGNNAHGGKYMGRLGKECFSVTYLFSAEETSTAVFTLSTDSRTTTYSKSNAKTEPNTLPLNQVYEFHVNGRKINLKGDLSQGSWLDFKEINLGKATIQKGLNTVSLTHILRNGENGNIDFIGVKSATNTMPLEHNRQLIEGEDMQVSGTDTNQIEGHNSSRTGTNQTGDCVRNRGVGQSGFAMAQINSQVARKAALLINFGLNIEFDMSEWNIYVNNVKVNNVNAKMPDHFWDGIAWVDWNEIYVCDIDLTEGANTIKIEKPSNSTKGTNMDYIVVLTADYYDDVPEDDSITNIAITKQPNQMLFSAGEPIDLTGIEVKVNYANGSSTTIGKDELVYSNSNLVAGVTQFTVSYRGHSATLIGLTVANPTKYYLEAEQGYAYWSKPNNHDSSNQFVISQEAGNNAHGGKYMGKLGKECFGVTFMFESNNITSATFTLSTDSRTTTYDQQNVKTESDTLPLNQVYEFHVNGKKVELSGNLVHGTWLSFVEVSLGKVVLKKGLNTVSLTHILRNGENGNIDCIGVNTPADVSIKYCSSQLIEGEDMQVSGDDVSHIEGNNASMTGTNQTGDCVRNRGVGQSGSAIFTISSSTAKTVALLINFGLNVEFDMSEWNIYVNNNKIANVNALIPDHFWSGIGWVDWNELYICDLALNAGTNTIKIEKPNTTTKGTNMDYVVILSAN